MLYDRLSKITDCLSGYLSKQHPLLSNGISVLGDWAYLDISFPHTLQAVQVELYVSKNTILTCTLAYKATCTQPIFHQQITPCYLCYVSAF